jgi:hypothetical protein
MVWNNRPRKCANFKVPFEVYTKQYVVYFHLEAGKNGVVLRAILADRKSPQQV